jgi:hypothetical protein|tara:strand:+ start:264 stop:719 length:456 start_codon:yes stop_codon:yes gene_type:complete
MTTKSFRGLLADGAIQTIPLSTNNGSTGYKIIKFEIMTNSISAASVEHTIQIFKIPQAEGSATQVIDFSNPTLLAAAVTMSRVDAFNAPLTSEVIFDNEIFNQDIYVTHKDNQSSEACNYYIELEMVKLALDENTVATLKDIRNIESAKNV